MLGWVDRRHRSTQKDNKKSRKESHVGHGELHMVRMRNRDSQLVMLTLRDVGVDPRQIEPQDEGNSHDRCNRIGATFTATCLQSHGIANDWSERKYVGEDELGWKGSCSGTTQQWNYQMASRRTARVVRVRVPRSSDVGS
jgi:hypothetical protein